MHDSPANPCTRSNRVLVIDDNPAIHADVRKILCPPVSAAAASLDILEAELLGGKPVAPRMARTFEVDDAHQGREAVELARAAVAEKRPYAMAFVDVRMPPGWDGVETTLELWKIDPELQIVICTAYSDYSWDDMLAKLGSSDRLVILKKPFDPIEVLQLTNALTEKWNLVRQARMQAGNLESRVRARTSELESANVTLQNEIAQRIVMEIDLKRSKESAESADRAKSAFLANMSHEIRTPMNGVIGMANLLLSTPLNAEQRDLAQTLCQSSEALLTIINDILDFSKIEAGRLILESVDFDLSEHLSLAMDLHADAAAKKGLELVMDIDPAVPSRVRGDPVRLRQVVLNLVGNAVKFTLHGEVVLRVSLVTVQNEKHFLRFDISDTGIGISPEVQRKLFEPFVQADSSTTRRFGGTGLGLAICKRIAELMCGEIGVISNAGKGSTFWFTAVLENPSEPAPKLALTPSVLEHHHALIVDDNATNRKLLKHLCNAWRMRHEAVDGAAAAMTALRRATAAGTPFDLVILDHHMPDVDGLQLAAMIRGDAKIPRPIQVLLTSRGERLSPEQMESHGLAACDLKPLHHEKLRLTLARIMANARRIASSAPFAPPPITTVSATQEPPKTLILVAEDNPVNQKVTLLQLKNLGYPADLAVNGREALEKVQQKPYRLIFMDAQMPEMDGIEATRQIRARQAEGNSAIVPDLKIVAMTANAMAGDREMCLNAGMDDYMAKPVKPEALREVINRYLAPKLKAVAESPALALAK